MRNLFRGKVVNGKYQGVCGVVDTSILGYKLFQNVMFYPDNKDVCYRVCLNIKDIEIIKEG